MPKWKKILILSVKTLSLILVLSVFVFNVAYAWFAAYKEAGDLGFKVLQIDSVVNLYQGNDTNGNGVLDLLDNDSTYKSMKDENDPNYNTYISYSEYYYIEKYDFSFKDSKYALSKDSSANLLNNIMLNDMTPSKVYTIKFEAINYSEYENNMYFEFSDTPNEITLDLLKQIKIRFGYVKNDTTSGTDVISYNFTEWLTFLGTNDTAYSGLKINTEENPYILPAKNEYMSDGISHHGKIDFWLQIKLDETSTIPNTSTFSLPELRITFEIPDGTISGS